MKNEQNTKINSIVTERVVTEAGTINANAAGNLETTISKSGYKAIAAFPAYSTISAVIAQGCTVAGNTLAVAVRNISNVQVAGVQYYVNVVYIKN